VTLVDYIGWTATAVFVGSYFFRRPETLRRVQMLGASIWMAYGVLMKAPPVIVANLLVLLAAVVTARRGPKGDTSAGDAVAVIPVVAETPSPTP
jgi:hypothetical protein